MKVTIIDPKIETLKKSYKVSSTSLKVEVGTNTMAFNIENSTLNTSWFLKDEMNQVVSGGIVNVNLNSFNTILTVTGLEPNKIYVLSIKNMIGSVFYTECIICTYNTVNIVDETFKFLNPIASFGNIYISEFEQTVQFRKTWLFSDTEGYGLIKDLISGKVYTYVPSKILVPYINTVVIPNVYSYIPFDTFKIYSVPVSILPRIERLYNNHFEITPATRLTVTYRTASEPYNKLITNEAVSSLVLDQNVSEVLITSVF